MFGNVRGGGWFRHNKYEEQNAALQNWMAQVLASHKKVVVLEIGASFNTPTVTRFPVEAFARDAEAFGKFIRINPSDAEVPPDLTALSIPEGWESLLEVAQAAPLLTSAVPKAEAKVDEHQRQEGLVSASMQTARMRRYFGDFNWRKFLNQLRNE
jgi:hypothetical protein